MIIKLQKKKKKKVPWSLILFDHGIFSKINFPYPENP